MPFDPSKPITTRNGQPARILGSIVRKKGQRLVVAITMTGIVEEHIFFHLLSGVIDLPADNFSTPGVDCIFDLVNA